MMWTIQKTTLSPYPPRSRLAHMKRNIKTLLVGIYAILITITVNNVASATKVALFQPEFYVKERAYGRDSLQKLDVYIPKFYKNRMAEPAMIHLAP